ncbi:MAG: HEAT repeat domain-containing protein [Chloroflexi bacterium]|nr:HEAT repeat domain-containing protein [Chloroflexota bacterium]MCC6892275.1 HEAT repeat domain-containing protein [Anaerolineae bacterium]
MNKHVFVSYKHEEQEFVEMLIRQLLAAGFKVWIDTEQLRAGENWRESINDAIKDCFALILVISPESKASQYVTYEWAYAQGAGVKVIPLLYKATEKLHPQIENLQYLDFTDRARPSWDKLMRRLFELQGEHQPHSVIVSRDAPTAVHTAVAALDSHNAEERRSALKSLAQMNHPTAYAALVGAVQHPMRDVRVDAAFLLAKQTNYKDAAAVPGLLDALSDEDARIRTAACKALGDIGDGAAVTELLRVMVKDNDSNIRWQATGALGKIGADAVPGLCEALRDEDWKVRRSAAEALWPMHEAQAIPALAEALIDRNDVVRQAASGALDAMGAIAVPGLIEVMKTSKEAMVSRAAADMLQKIGSAQGLEAVQKWNASRTAGTGNTSRLGTW